MINIFKLSIISLLLCNIAFSENYNKEKILKLSSTKEFRTKLFNSTLPDCTGTDNTKWQNCFGSHKNEEGRKTHSEYGPIVGKRNGMGFSILNGLYVQGIFSNDKFIYGTIFYPNKNKFQGSFNDKGNFQGFGKFTFKNGEIYVGNFVNHKLQGKGKVIKPDGTVKKVTFKDGKIID